MKQMLLFSGQGTQSVGMGKELAEGLPACGALFSEASEILGFDLLKLCTEGPIEELTRSCNTQPAIFVVSSAARLALTHFAGDSLKVEGVAGLSLGEWAALEAVGVISFADTVRILKARGQFMQDACDATPGGMLTLIGLNVDQAKEIAATAQLEVANLNSSVQTVLSGPLDRIPAGVEAAKALGAKRALPLKVAGAFHSSLMQPAADRLADFLKDVEFKAPNGPVWSNVTGELHTTPDEIRRLMVAQVVSSVRWNDCFVSMASSGMTHAYECGPGAVLAGLGKRIDPSISFQNIFDLAGAEAAAKLSAE